MARGYLNLPELTAEKFVQSPFRDGSRLYRSGDRVRWTADGQLDYLGRTDRQIKWWGYRIEPGEIEHVLLQHPAVRQAVVSLREDVPGQRRLVAYLVGGSKPDMQSFLSTKLPAHMIPASYQWLEALPLAPNGKIDRAALPRPTAPLSHAKTEQAVAQIWCQVLGLPTVERHQDFFALGGQSMQLVEMLTRTCDALGVDLPFHVLYQARTVAALAEQIERSRSHKPESKSVSTLAILRSGGSLPPLFCAHAIGGRTLCYLALAEELGEDQPVYGLDYDEASEEAVPPPGIIDMARRYVQAMREVQPRGPYHLCGYSFGGVLAFEMARQLVESGDSVAYLAMIDAHAPVAANTQQSDPDWLAAMSLKARLYAWFGATPERRALARWLTRSSLYLKMTRLTGGFGQNLRGNLMYYRNARRQLAVLPSYRPPTYAGKVTLFRACADLRPDASRTLGWEELVTSPLDVIPIDCHHWRLLKVPHVRELAQQMRSALSPSLPKNSPL